MQKTYSYLSHKGIIFWLEALTTPPYCPLPLPPHGDQLTDVLLYIEAAFALETLHPVTIANKLP